MQICAVRTFNGFHQAGQCDTNVFCLYVLKTSLNFSGLTMGTHVSECRVYHADGHARIACAYNDSIASVPLHKSIPR